MKFNKRGEIVNSHCECPAGKGPHGSCKHVAAVSFILSLLKEEGKAADVTYLYREAANVSSPSQEAYRYAYYQMNTI